MQSLLRWSIENAGDQSTSNEGASQQPTRPKELDTGVLDVIMGRPESELMKEALAVAVDSEKSEDDRLQALDDFEMLIENIDNANNIEKMGMWQPLQDLLTSEKSSDEVQAAVLWIIGTAVQNNPSAQNAYLSLLNSPLTTVLSRLSPKESSKQTRSKAVYALSGLLKHNSRGVKLLGEEKGWSILKSALEDPDITVRRKAVFLLSSLLLPSATSESVSSEQQSGARLHGSNVTGDDQPQQPVHANSHASMTAESTATSGVTVSALQEHGITSELVRGLVDPIPYGINGDQERDTDLEEKLVRLFHTYLTSAGGKLDAGNKQQLHKWIQNRRGKGETWDLGSQELDELQSTLA